MMITNICNDKENCNESTNSDQGWIYIVNGQMGDVAADKYILKEGDRIEWKLTTVSM